jgi:hypothetical protein
MRDPKRPKPPLPQDRHRSPRYKSRGNGARAATTKKLTLRDLTRQFLETEDLQAFFRELDFASDRSAAIVGAATVERYLEEAIFATLNRADDETRANLSATGGALDGLFAKIHLGCALGVYPAQYMHELESIRKIRNCFAHSPKHLTFDTVQISDECGRLNSRHYVSGSSDSRSRYASACRILIMFLLIYKMIASGERALRRHKPNTPYYAEAEAAIQRLKGSLRLLIASEDIIDKKILRAPSSNDS